MRWEPKGQKENLPRSHFESVVKDWNLNSSPDLIDKAVMVNLVSMVKETEQNTKIIMNQNFTIIASLSKVLKEILELKQSRNNDTFGDFA